MSKYIDAEKLKGEIMKLRSESCISESDEYYECAKSEIINIIDSLQQEHLKDSQIVVITESHGDANIEWDCRSLEDVMTLLKSAESFITNKQVEKLRGSGCGPDYDTTEGRYSNLRKYQQEQSNFDDGDPKHLVHSHYTKVRETKTGRVFWAEYSSEAAEWYEAGTGKAYSISDVEIVRIQPEVELEKEIANMEFMGSNDARDIRRVARLG